MSAAHHELANQLEEARHQESADERAELRDEVRIKCLLLIAHELEFCANALTKAAEHIDTAIHIALKEDQS